ncbi:MAG: YkgJ family cysteine cluster protein [Bacteroidales bacterium]|nr:YkgJ family cysteine cluster protein [Bacteroidales bacterium]
MECRPDCGACCIYPSISSPIPGMPDGKPAGVRCVNLSDNLSCKIFDHPDRPDVCAGFKPDHLFCGDSSEQAAEVLMMLQDE